MITKYQIVEGESAAQLAVSVGVMIRDGWQPLGGVAIGTWRNEETNREGTLYAQAVVFGLLSGPIA